MCPVTPSGSGVGAPEASLAALTSAACYSPYESAVHGSIYLAGCAGVEVAGAATKEDRAGGLCFVALRTLNGLEGRVLELQQDVPVWTAGFLS